MIQHQTFKKEKIVLALNGALSVESVENAVVERLQVRIDEVSLSEAKQQFQHHLEETKGQQLILNMGGSSIQEKEGLPLPSFPQSIKQMMEQYLTKEEWELEKAEEYMIIENAEVACYNMILQKSQVLKFNEMVEPLTQSLLQEEKMAQ